MSSQLTISRPAEILLVEDSENDVELTRVGFRKSKLRHNMHRVKNGEECMAFLRKQAGYANVPTPDLILLDLNMPRMSGHEVLKEMGGDETLVSIPVVVLTTSAQDEEILKMYKLRCSSYIIKPVDFERFLQIIRSLAEYWFTIVALPANDSPEKATAGAGTTLGIAAVRSAAAFTGTDQPGEAWASHQERPLKALY